MSEVFEGYERQYCEISASLSRKCAAASALDGEKKKQKLSEIQADVQESETLIRKMDLEARSLQPSVKAGLLAKLRDYKSDLSSVKGEIKKVSAPNAHQATREELLEAGMSDTLAASSDQRGRLMMTSERLNQSSDRIRESQRTVFETEEIGVSILQDLHNQRQSLLHAHTTMTWWRETNLCGRRGGGRTLPRASGCSGRWIGDASTAPIRRGEKALGRGHRLLGEMDRGSAGGLFLLSFPYICYRGRYWGAAGLALMIIFPAPAHSCTAWMTTSAKARRSWHPCPRGWTGTSGSLAALLRRSFSPSSSYCTSSSLVRAKSFFPRDTPNAACASAKYLFP